MMNRECPFCSSNSFSGSYLPSTYFNKKDFEYIKCSACKLIYLSPFPDENDMQAMYPSSYQSGVDHTLVDLNKKLPGLRFPYGKHFELMSKYAPGKKILDYGCGTANFLINVKKAGWDCDGAEFNSAHIAILKKEIPDSEFYLIDELLKKNDIRYDVIRLSNVLEHLTDPRSVIQKLTDKLNTNGILLIEGPIETNFSFALLFRKLYFRSAKLFRKKRSVIHPPTHIFFSNSKNQLELFSKFPLEKMHYQIIECAWPFPEKGNEIKGLGSFFKFIIAKISIALSKLSFGKWGNTFIYVGKIKS